MQIGDRVTVAGRRGEFRLRRFRPEMGKWEVLEVAQGFCRFVDQASVKPHISQERFDRQLRIMAKHAGLHKLRRLARDLGISAEDVFKRLDREAAIQIQQRAKDGAEQMARAEQSKGGS